MPLAPPCPDPDDENKFASRKKQSSKNCVLRMFESKKSESLYPFFLIGNFARPTRTGSRNFGSPRWRVHEIRKISLITSPGLFVTQSKTSPQFATIGNVKLIHFL